MSTESSDFTVVHNATGSPGVLILRAATGLPEAELREVDGVTVIPWGSELDLGETETPVTRTLRLYSVGAAPLVFTAFSVTAEGWAVTDQPPADTVIPVGEYITIELTFTPPVPTPGMEVTAEWIGVVSYPQPENPITEGTILSGRLGQNCLPPTGTENEFDILYRFTITNTGGTVLEIQILTEGTYLGGGISEDPLTYGGDGFGAEPLTIPVGESRSFWCNLTPNMTNEEVSGDINIQDQPGGIFEGLELNFSIVSSVPCIE